MGGFVFLVVIIAIVLWVLASCIRIVPQAYAIVVERLDVYKRQVLDLRVTKVKEDGKMDVSDREEAYIQINEDAESVFSIIEEFAGVLPFDDKASPEVIKREFGLSKNAFKRAVGHLLKEGKIEIKDRRIYIVK